VTPYFQTPPEPDFKDGMKYGYKWWLFKLPDSAEYVWLALGFGGQDLLVFPNEAMIVTFTMWDLLPNSTGRDPTPSPFLALVKTKTCPSDTGGQLSTSEERKSSKHETQAASRRYSNDDESAHTGSQ
jgi:hypothetical protein